MAMHAPQSEQKEYERPVAGATQGVCCDVLYMGLKKVEHQGEVKLKPKVRISFQIDQYLTTGDYAGQRFMVHQTMTYSLFQSAILKKFVEQFIGRKLTDDECEGRSDKYFDFDTLIGRNAMLNLIETSKGGRTYTNISTAMPWDKKFGADMEVENYIRMADRPDYKGPQDDLLEDHADDPEDGFAANSQPPASRNVPAQSSAPYGKAPSSAPGYQAAESAGAERMTKEQRSEILGLTERLWGKSAGIEWKKFYPPIPELTVAYADMVIAELNEKLLVPAGGVPDDDFDDSDPFADQ